MSKLLIFIFNIIFISFPLSQSDDLPDVICAYGDNALISTSHVDDIPERCKAIQPSIYYMSMGPIQKNKNSLKALVNTNKTVIIRVTIPEFKTWTECFTDATSITELTKYIKENEIKGIMLDKLDIYDDKKTEFAQQISDFVKNLKKEIEKLTVYMVIYASLKNKFTEFDFDVINKQINIYILDAANAGEVCNTNLAKSGRFVQTSNDDRVVSLEKIYSSMKNSSIDKNKTFINVSISVERMYMFAGEYQIRIMSYVDYCDKYPEDKESIWCADSLKMFYENGSYLKDKFKGIMLMFLSNDDYEGKCECGKKYPVANTYLDGWEKKTFKECTKISGPRALTSDSDKTTV